MPEPSPLIVRTVKAVAVRSGQGRRHQAGKHQDDPKVEYAMSFIEQCSTGKVFNEFVLKDIDVAGDVRK